MQDCCYCQRIQLLYGPFPRTGYCCRSQSGFFLSPRLLSESFIFVAHLSISTIEMDHEWPRHHRRLSPSNFKPRVCFLNFWFFEFWRVKKIKTFFPNHATERNDKEESEICLPLYDYYTLLCLQSAGIIIVSIISTSTSTSHRIFLADPSPVIAFFITLPFLFYQLVSSTNRSFLSAFL